MINIKNVVELNKCVGCGSCANICEYGAVTMVLNNEGFYISSVDEDICIGCRQCDSVCPVLNYTYTNFDNPECYAFMAEDYLRAISSSGGAFSILANVIFEKKGLICGVVFADDCRKVKYIMTDLSEDLNKIRGSKYIAVDTGKIYSQVREQICAGRYVLFCGLPCHIAGLKSFLNELFYSNYLLTVDLICSGVGSVKAFDNYLRDIHGNRPIKSIKFRDKVDKWQHSSITIEFMDGSLSSVPFERDYYGKSFLRGLVKNRPCTNCLYARLPRQGDITIGDFWGVSNYNPKLNDSKGTSVILFNNDKAIAYKDDFFKGAKLFETVPLEYATKGNITLFEPPHVNNSRSQFLKKINTRRYQELVTWGLDDSRYDIGIVGIPLYPNFGGTLTYYSLYQVLKDRGYSVALFSRPRSTGKPPIDHKEIYEECPFAYADMKLDFRDKNAMGNYANNNCDCFVVGSDQLFNADLYKSFGEIVTLDWVSDNHRKIAYAASFGHDFFWGHENLRANMSYYMQKFDAFSVREESAVELVKSMFKVDAEWVLDPVFLCDPEHYIKLSEHSKYKNKSPHIFAYILDPSKDKEEMLTYVEKKLDIETDLYSEMVYKLSNDIIEKRQRAFNHNLKQGKVEERLYSLINSNLIITDSFHGVCFAIIFNKPFVAILNPLRGASRFYTILGKFGLLDRLIVSVQDLEKKEYLLKEIDYSNTNIILAAERKRCLAWLINNISISDSEKKPFSTEDVTKKLFENRDKQILQNEIKLNSIISGGDYLKAKNIYDYLDILSSEKNHLDIYISVKDTPGFALNSVVNRKLGLLGTKISLVNKHWHSYVAVIEQGILKNEMISQEEERVGYIDKMPYGEVKVVSRSYNQGNGAYIFINGVNYAENVRGLNFVVYDRIVNGFIDSVCFDTHDSNINYFRFGKKYIASNPAYVKSELIYGRNEYSYDLVKPDNFDINFLDWIYYCQLAVQSLGNRKFVLWDYNETLYHVLRYYFDIDVQYVISNEKIEGFDSITFDKLNKDIYYVLIPNKLYNEVDERRLVNKGYNEIRDYLYKNIRPIVLKNRNIKKEPYYDVYNNRIIGEYDGYSTIVLRGYNNFIDLGTKPSIKIGSELLIDCGSNTIIKLGDYIRYVDKVEFICMGQYLKNVSVGDRVVFMKNQIRMIGICDSVELSIGDGTSFQNDTFLRVFSGKKLIIGKDVMFSSNIEVLCGDGHTIFNVESHQNINSDCSNNETDYVIVGNHVWIGMNTTVLIGSKICSGSIVGACSLLKGHFPNNCSIGGNPARIIKKNIAWSRKDCSKDITDCNSSYVETTYSEKEVINKGTVLVLCERGLLGVRLVEQLIRSQYNVTIATKDGYKDYFGNNIKRIIVDRSDEKSILSAFEVFSYNIIIDCSAFTPHGVDNVLKHIKCDKYIQISSAAVYENSKVYRKEEIVNSGKCEYLSTGTFSYQIAKRYAESVLLQKYPNINSAIVRLPVVLDELDISESVHSTQLYFYVNHIYNNIPFNEHNLNRKCSFARVSDVVDFIIYLAENEFEGIYNFSSEGDITLQDIINYIENKTRKNAIISADAEVNPLPFGGYVLDVTKAKKTGTKITNLSSWLYRMIDGYIDICDRKLS